MILVLRTGPQQPPTFEFGDTAYRRTSVVASVITLTSVSNFNKVMHVVCLQNVNLSATVVACLHHV